MKLNACINCRDILESVYRQYDFSTDDNNEEEESNDDDIHWEEEDSNKKVY
jgi:hypothetical protein